MRVRFATITALFCMSATFVCAQRKPAVLNEPIEGVQPAALDQPRIYLNLRRTAAGEFLTTKDKDKLSGIEAFLDTGASGVMLSADTVEKLRVVKSPDVIFEDIGIGGAEHFGVTEPLFVAMAEYPRSDPETGDYSTPAG